MANAASGLIAPMMTAAMAKLVRMARNDWRNGSRNPSKGASMEFSRPLPAAVRSMMSGN